MATRIPMQSIVVQRPDSEGVLRNVTPEIGKPYEFTEAELKELADLAPDAVRAPINETPEKPATKKSEGKAADGKGKEDL